VRTWVHRGRKRVSDWRKRGPGWRNLAQSQCADSEEMTPELGSNAEKLLRWSWMGMADGGGHGAAGGAHAERYACGTVLHTPASGKSPADIRETGSEIACLGSLSGATDGKLIGVQFAGSGSEMGPAC